MKEITSRHTCLIFFFVELIFFSFLNKFWNLKINVSPTANHQLRRLKFENAYLPNFFEELSKYSYVSYSCFFLEFVWRRVGLGLNTVLIRRDVCDDIDLHPKRNQMRNELYRVVQSVNWLESPGCAQQSCPLN